VGGRGSVHIDDRRNAEWGGEGKVNGRKGGSFGRTWKKKTVSNTSLGEKIALAVGVSMSAGGEGSCEGTRGKKRG